MKEMKNIRSYSFLTIGKTQESTETQEYKRYIGVGSSYVMAVNPDKKKLDELMGYESPNEPEYVKDGENGKEAYVTFIVRTDPESNGGIEITNRMTFVLRNEPAYNRDKSKVQVIDSYGNSTWVDTETAKAGGQLPANYKICQTKYRMAANGEADLVSFLKTFLVVPGSLNYVNGAWTLNEKAEEGKFELEHIKDYFNGDFSEIKQAIALQPNNKIKLLYGVRTNEGKQYQAIATKGDLILRNSAGSNALAKADKDLTSMKENGSYPNTDFRIQELQEYSVEPTNLEAAPAGGADNSMPWD